MSTALEPLAAGQRMMRPEFHARYRAMPSGTTFELIGGKVHMASPVSDRHGDKCGLAGLWLGHYAVQTPGARVNHAGSVILDDLSEVQPDVSLRVDAERGGRSRLEGAYRVGCPELVVEVSRSSREIDLGPKFAAYDRAGVLEYVVLTLDPDEVHWHVRVDGRLIRVDRDGDGLYRSTAFPGLWLDEAAWYADDGRALLTALDRGLASPEHAAFAGRLAAARG